MALAQALADAEIITRSQCEKMDYFSATKGIDNDNNNNNDDEEFRDDYSGCDET